MVTVTDAVPAAPTFAGGTFAVSCELLTNEVVKGMPSQFTVEPATNPVPLTVRVNPGLSGAALFGTSGFWISGTGLDWASSGLPAKDKKIAMRRKDFMRPRSWRYKGGECKTRSSKCCKYPPKGDAYQDERLCAITQFGFVPCWVRN